MKIYRRSWHYRVAMWPLRHEGQMPKHLCDYFWHVVLCLGMVPFGMTTFCVALLCCAVTAVLVSPLIATVLLIDWTKGKLTGNPSLLGEWIAAKRDRVFPAVELED